MEPDRRAVFEELSELQDRLTEEYELVDSLVGRSGLTGELNEAIALLQYRVAVAARTTSELIEDTEVWEA